MTDLAVADLSHIPVSQGLAATLARASEGARATGAQEVSLEHVLAALCDDPDAADVLAASQIDSARLKSETIAYLAQSAEPGGVRLPPGGQIGVSPPLMRILEAAAAAARGGRRRDINGAIVLAAIVGDGSSKAAQLLQAHGLTFDGAIRALQAALAQPSRNDTPSMAPAEDVLARARERVQSRATPSLRDIMREKSDEVTQGGPRPASPVTGNFPDRVAPYGASDDDQQRDLEAPAQEFDTADDVRADSAAPPPSSPNAPRSEIAPPPSSEGQPAGSPPQSPPFQGGGATDTAKPQSGEASTPPAAPSPSRQAAPSAADSGPNWQPPVERPAAPPSWVNTAPPGGATPKPLPPVAPQPAFPAPALPADGVSGQSAAGPPPGGLPQGGPLPPSTSPPGFEVRRTGGPQPPPIPPPMPKGPPSPGGFGAAPLARGPGAPHAMPPGFPPANAPAGPHSLPMGRPQAPAAGVTPSAKAPSPSLASAPAKPRRKEAPREPEKAELGQLTENVPRAMRVGVTERVEIRIGRAHIKNMAEGMEGGGLAWQHEVTVTKAMSVRVRAPEGGFFIETASPETQWIDNQFDEAGNDFASWRFLITPQHRGWATLRIIISARTVGSDGVVAETAFPDQVIEVKVRTNYGKAFKRTLGWLLAAIVGGALARFGEGAFDIGSGLISKFLS
ncbi:MAG: Clp protease N-terminal domain-containing protein [Hyphomicrobium sp.]